MYKKIILIFLTLLFLSVFSSGCNPPSQNNLPTVQIISPLNNSKLSGIITIKVQASDPDGASDISKIELFIDGDKITEIENTYLEYTLNTTDYVNGYHILRAIAWDKKGGKGESSINVQFDNVNGPLYVECMAMTYYGTLTVSDSEIEKLENSKLHPKLISAIKEFSSGKKERTNVKEYNSINKEKVSVLPSNYHIYFEIWWKEVSGANKYRIYISDDFKNYKLIAETLFTNIYWGQAEFDLGLEPGKTYRIKVKAVIGGLETAATYGTWDITPLGVINLVSPEDRQLNVPISPLNFTWQNAVGNPTAWDIYVNTNFTSGYDWYYYEEGTMKTSINYNCDGRAKFLYPGTVYEWQLCNYGSLKYSQEYGDYVYFTFSISKSQIFQTYASDYVRIKWQNTNHDLDLGVLEPNGYLYSARSTGLNAPNGIFVGDEPIAHGFTFEQYSYKSYQSISLGTYIFAVRNPTGGTVNIQLEFRIGNDQDVRSISIPPTDPDKYYVVLTINLLGSPPKVEFMGDMKKIYIPSDN